MTGEAPLVLTNPNYRRVRRAGSMGFAAGY
jgi:hypothetical protein